MPRPSKYVLLVDDDESILDQYKKVLESNQSSEFEYRVETARTRPEGTSKAQMTSFDLVITDVRLAGEDDDSGFQLGIEMNQRNIPVIVMTRTDKFPEMRELADARRPAETPAEFNLYDKADFHTTPRSLTQLAEITIKGRSVFVVHGRDNAALDEVKRFVESVGYQPVILKDVPNLGKSILDKLHAYSNVRFTIVLMTPDDVGGLRQDNTTAYQADTDLHKRARQNVIFELGYFIGRHGSSRVSALVVDGIEIPSDYHGILYTTYRPGYSDWQRQICVEMRSAGLDVDCP